jgi:hypothetical protein
MTQSHNKTLNIFSLQFVLLAMLVVIIFLFGCGIILYFYYIYPNIIKGIPNKIMNCTGVKKVTVFEEDLSELQITIDFNNGGTVELWNVDENLKGNITIERFDNYGFYIFSHRGLYSSTINLKLLNILTNNKFKTVYDIVEHYDTIKSLVYNWPNISNLKEYGDKTVRQIVDRNINIFPSVIFKEHNTYDEIFFSLKNYDDSGGIWRLGAVTSQEPTVGVPE